MIKEKLEEAYKRKENAIGSFIWKGKKQALPDGSFAQNQVLLIDCDQNQLQSFYNHCKSMLYNEDRIHPGRKILLDIIKEQRDRCNAELFIRYIEKDGKISKYSFLSSIKQFLDNNPTISVDDPICQAVGGLEGTEYSTLPIKLVCDACTDELGKFDRSHITLAFILKQGLWYSPEESKDLTEHTEDGNIRDKKEVVKERLGLKTNINLYTSPKGLNYTQLRAMINLKSTKYSDLTSIQLETLRNRILFALEDDVKFHVKQWETHMDQIERVAEAKDYVLI